MFGHLPVSLNALQNWTNFRTGNALSVEMKIIILTIITLSFFFPKELSSKSCDDCAYCNIQQKDTPCCPSNQDSDEQSDCCSYCACHVVNNPYITITFSKDLLCPVSKGSFISDVLLHWNSIFLKPPFPPPKHRIA